MSTELKFKLQTLFIFILIVGVPIYLAYLDIKQIKKRKEEQNKLEERLTNDIETTVKNGTTLQFSDLESLYLSIWDSDNILLDELKVILKALRHSKRNIAVKAEADTEKCKSYLVRINKLIKDTQNSLEVESKNAPFVGVSDPERGYLEDMHESVIGTEKEDYTFAKLKDLASSINLRESESQKYIDEQQKSLKLSKIGLWSTVIFSLISISLSFYLS